MGWLNSGVAAVWRAGQAVGSIGRLRAATPRGPSDDFWYEPTGAGVNHAGIAVTPDIALKASAVYACVKILAETIATMPLAIHRELPGGGRVPAPEHPLDELIRFQPNSWQTAVEFWEMTILHAALRGTGYAEIKPGQRGAVDQLIPLHTDRVKAERLPDGSLRFKVTNPKTGQMRTLLQEEVFRIPGMSSDGVNGLRAVDLASEAIGLGMAADGYAARVFSNRLNMGGFLVHPGKITTDAQKNLIDKIMERLAGVENAHRPMILQEGIKFEKASMDAKAAQLIEARKWQIGEIARYWRIPLHMLNIDDQTNRSTVESQALDFVKYTLRPWVRRIEQAARRDLIVAKRTYSLKFNMDALLRGDSAARASYFSAALGSGGSPPWMTQNEVRVREGMNESDEPGANRLGVGTNPDTSGQQALVDDSPRGRAGRLARKEIAAVRRALMRFAGEPDAFRTWVSAFYGGHVSFTMETLDCTKYAAKTYCEYQRGDLLASNDLEATLDRWQADLATEIADTLEQAAQGDPT